MGTAMMEHNLEAIMKVMRIAIGRSKTRINLTEMLDAISNEGNYPLMFSKDHLKDLQSEKDPNAMIPYCSLSVIKDVNGEDPLNPECQLQGVPRFLGQTFSCMMLVLMELPKLLIDYMKVQEFSILKWYGNLL